MSLPELDTHVLIVARRITIRESEIEWTELDPERWFDNKDNKVFLQKSDSPKSGFKTIATLSRNSPRFFMDDNASFSMYRTEILYYRLYSKDAGIVSKVFSCEKLHNLYGAEIMHRHYIQLKEGHSGNPMYLFIKKRTGDRCPECWDNIRGVRTKSNCKTCLNTGYINGYHDPICVYVSLAPEQIAVDQPSQGTSVEGRLQGWTIAYPRINLGDVLVDPATQDIWCVASTSMTTHKRTPTKQDIMVDRHAEDTSITKLLSLIPKTLKKEDMRHGELLF